MKILLLYGCVIALICLITALQEFGKDSKRIGVTYNNGTHKQILQHNAKIIKTEYPGQLSQNYNGIGMQYNKNGTRKKRQRLGMNRNNTTEDQREMLWSSKHQNIRKKKNKTSKLFHSPKVYNTTKNLQKRSAEYEDTLNTVYNSQDISTIWNTQKDFSEHYDSHEFNSVSSSKLNDLNSSIMNEDHMVPSETSQPSSSESSHPEGFSESRDSSGSNESNSNSASHESLHVDSDEFTTVVDPLNSFESDVQKNIFYTPVGVSESINDLSDSSSQSLISENSNETIEQNGSDDSNGIDSKSSSDSSEATIYSDSITESNSNDDEITVSSIITDEMGNDET